MIVGAKTKIQNVEPMFSFRPSIPNDPIHFPDLKTTFYIPSRSLGSPYRVDQENLYAQ